ncbi:hypothetical protein DVH24_016127 [Malus domestica]|uniref:Uncharacterized protein n=1 Tax=Malus domestica TaxID=3750 RepID=A0A498JEW9_MALDO|nr:hypothetical protein DVH24_016127 [Malus domestica]
MEDLEVLNVAHCTFIEDSEHPGYSYICEQLGDKFLLCPTLICDMCEDGVAADEDVFRWYRFDDEI